MTYRRRKAAIDFFYAWFLVLQMQTHLQLLYINYSSELTFVKKSPPSS